MQRDSLECSMRSWSCIVTSTPCPGPDTSRILGNLRTHRNVINTAPRHSVSVHGVSGACQYHGKPNIRVSPTSVSYSLLPWPVLTCCCLLQGRVITVGTGIPSLPRTQADELWGLFHLNSFPERGREGKREKARQVLSLSLERAVASGTSH